MYGRIILFVTLLGSAASQAVPLSGFSPGGMTLPEYWGDKYVWWDGRASFKGQVIIPACTLAMEDLYQAINMGETPIRDIQNSFVGSEKKFHLRLRNCELAGTGKRVYTASRVRVTFDGKQGETPDRFAMTGLAKGINLQILDNQGYLARSGKAMPPLLLNGNEEGFNYTLRIVRNGQPLKVGNYYATLRFKLDYE
ncbi:fimbrial protein [Escherichia coli]|uniref:fimbrial protein n=1 Tax=Escherichia coli TaxID=562 RepID=UPI0013024A4C|nr:fimbrial protein [Escherichia coli]KAE9666515.1 fimbrial protein [Escherichia coli]